MIPFHDPESEGGLFGEPVKLDLHAADDGIEVIGHDLVRIVGGQSVDIISLGFYLHCFDTSARTVIRELVDKEYLVAKPLSEYQIHPDRLPKPKRSVQATEPTEVYPG